MGKLHDQLKASATKATRSKSSWCACLFCLFAEDTGDLRAEARSSATTSRTRTARTAPTSACTSPPCFEVLNTPEDKRQKALDEQLAAFPYVNGKLFEERLPIAAFDCGHARRPCSTAAPSTGAASRRPSSARCSRASWTPRRGATSARTTPAKPTSSSSSSRCSSTNCAPSSKSRQAQQEEAVRVAQEARRLTLPRPRLRLRQLPRHRLPRAAPARARDPAPYVSDSGQMHLDIFQLVQIDVDQFYGIEIEEFPAQIAQVALWLTDHQMNMRVSEEFGHYYVRLPLKHAPASSTAMRWRLDWNEVVPAVRLDYLLGNPPFVGKHYQDRDQKAELLAAFEDLRGASDLDYVACWYRKAAEYMTPRPEIRAAFVSTNSITQGEQVGILWPDLYRLGVKIHFAHRTFQWTSEARGKAAVHCVIVGFGLQDAAEKWLFDYDGPKSEPHAIKAGNINAYLADAPDVIAYKRQQPLAPVPIMRCGNKPSDGGHLLLTPEEKAQLLAVEPGAAPWLKRYMGSEEFINGIERWCLWLDGIAPDVLRKLPQVLSRVETVRGFRLKSSAEPTRRMADNPTRFFFVSQPTEDYILIPEVSSERRRYVPVGLMPAEVISSNKNYLIAGRNLYVLGALQSAMHMAWLATVGGRLKSDFQYSATMVYNTFPWPDPTDKQRTAIEAAAQAVLDARTQFPGATLADLYDPLAMPPGLLKAHQQLDRAVDMAYGVKSFKSEAERVAFLFERYQTQVSLLTAEKPAKRRAKAAKTTS
jgi:hypothetical protein